jgi:imidazolonepropionase-like amidohydrolase
MSLRADTPYELVARVRQLADLGVDWVKVMESGGMSSPGTDPYQPQYPLAALGPAVAEAHRLGLRVAAHALCAAAVRVAIRAGIDTLEHGWTISGDRQDFEPEIAVELAASRIPGSVTAHDTLRNLLPEGDRAGDLATIRSRLIPHRALAAAGVPILVHSDAAFGRAHFDEFAKSVEVFQVGMNVTPVEAIRAATGIPARALGLDDHIGTVRVGLYADLLLVGGDAATDIRALRAVRRVILGGETVVINGRLVLPTASDEPLSTVM